LQRHRQEDTDVVACSSSATGLTKMQQGEQQRIRLVHSLAFALVAPPMLSLRSYVGQVERRALQVQWCACCLV
jgi:hypothetical protein